ncbi:MAG: hypothetical protein AAGF84_03770 [Planctomycetota bacterium]
MAEVAQIEFMDPVDFTVGADVYRGTRSLSFRKRGRRHYHARAEGSMTTTRKERIPNEGATVTGSVSSMSIQLLNLIDTEAATATVAGVDALTGNAVTLTLTNPGFTEFSGNPSETSPGTYQISYEADDISFA